MNFSQYQKLTGFTDQHAWDEAFKEGQIELVARVRKRVTDADLWSKDNVCRILDEEAGK